MRLALIATAAVLLASPALAQVGGAAPLQDPDKKPVDDPNRIVCKREHVVGSNRPQKVCMTVAQRQRLKDDADRMTDPGNRTAGTAADFKDQQPGG
jgi:hypothetical protein